MFNHREKFGVSSSIQSPGSNSKGFNNQDSSSEEDNEPFHGVRLSNDEEYSQSYSQNEGENNDFLIEENQGTLNIGENILVEDFQIQIERFLAEGGKAHVYTALIINSPINKGFKKPVSSKCVLKRIASPDKKELNLIEKEVSFMKALQGKPNIVEFYASKSQPLPHNQGFETFILMEYCSEGTLVEFMQQREQTLLKEAEILYFFHEICMGVLSMHQAEPPIIHRDLKVENILISSAQGLKLCDFGSSTNKTILAGTPINVAMAQTIEDELNSCTTLQYRSPEMIDLFQRRGLTEKMDIWALGVLLYKLCYFTTPFEDTGALAILNCKFDFPSSPDFQPSIKNFINWLLQENPSDRPDIEHIVEEICRIRGVPCSVIKKSSCTPDQRFAPDQKPKKNNSLLAEPLMAPLVQPQSPLFDFDTESITPMRRGRPTKSKTSLPVSPFSPQSSAPEKSNQPFTDTSSDPFEMLAKGFDLSSISQPKIPRPPSREQESPWSVFDVPEVIDQQTTESTFPASNKESSDFTSFTSNNFNISSHSYVSNPPSSSKANPPLPPPKPMGLTPRLPLSSNNTVPTPPPRASARASVKSKISSSNIIPPPKPARKPKSTSHPGET